MSLEKQVSSISVSLFHRLAYFLTQNVGQLYHKLFNTKTCPSSFSYHRFTMRSSRQRLLLINRAATHLYFWTCCCALSTISTTQEPRDTGTQTNYTSN